MMVGMFCRDLQQLQRWELGKNQLHDLSSASIHVQCSHIMLHRRSKRLCSGNKLHPADWVLSTPEGCSACKSLHGSQAHDRACLAEVVGLDGVVGYNIEGLKVDAAVGDDHTAWLTAQRRDAAAHHLQHNLLVLILQPPRIEALILFMALTTIHQPELMRNKMKQNELSDKERANTWIKPGYW